MNELGVEHVHVRPRTRYVWQHFTNKAQAILAVEDTVESDSILWIDERHHLPPRAQRPRAIARRRLPRERSRRRPHRLRRGGRPARRVLGSLRRPDRPRRGRSAVARDGRRAARAVLLERRALRLSARNPVRAGVRLRLRAGHEVRRGTQPRPGARDGPGDARPHRSPARPPVAGAVGCEQLPGHQLPAGQLRRGRSSRRSRSSTTTTRCRRSSSRGCSMRFGLRIPRSPSGSRRKARSTTRRRGSSASDARGSAPRVRVGAAGTTHDTASPSARRQCASRGRPDESPLQLPRPDRQARHRSDGVAPGAGDRAVAAWT